MVESHVRAAGNQRGEVGWIVCGARTTAVEHNTVVEHAAIVVFVLLQAPEEVEARQ